VGRAFTTTRRMEKARDWPSNSDHVSSHSNITHGHKHFHNLNQGVNDVLTEFVLPGTRFFIRRLDIKERDLHDVAKPTTEMNGEQPKHRFPINPQDENSHSTRVSSQNLQTPARIKAKIFILPGHLSPRQQPLATRRLKVGVVFFPNGDWPAVLIAIVLLQVHLELCHQTFFPLFSQLLLRGRPLLLHHGFELSLNNTGREELGETFYRLQAFPPRLNCLEDLILEGFLQSLPLRLRHQRRSNWSRTQI
jgi:hypothetical protein